MRIAFVCADPGVPIFGTKGSSVHAQSVIAAFLEAGANVEIFAARIGGEPPRGLHHVVVHEHGRPSTHDPGRREDELAAANALLGARLRAAGPFDLIYERHSLFAWAAMEVARETGAAGVLEVNAPLVAEQAAHRTLVNRLGAEAGVRRCLADAGVIVSVSEALRTSLERHPEARGKVHVIPNGVDPRRFPERRPTGPRPFTVAFVGTLKPWHGLPTLAQAFARLRAVVPDARLLVVGDGPGRADLEADLSAAGLSGAARLTGAVAPGDVAGLLEGADVTVAPYPATAERYFSPLKAVEGMAAGLPLVASRVGQLPELVRDGRTGVLCEPGDPVDLAEALVSLARDPERRERIGAAGRGWVLRERTWQQAVARILALATGQARGTEAEAAA
jgi:glycosyltransferase involved in cell wall biosynthesis